MALLQTKDIKIKKSKRTIHKEDLAKELNVSVAIINEYILGDKATPDNIKIIPAKKGMIIVESEERYETAKYEGVFYNPLKNGDRTFYIIYKDLKTNKPITLKIGRELDGITETFCVNKRKEVLERLRLGENQVKIKNKRVYSEILTLDKVAEKYHENRKLYLTPPNLQKSKSLYDRRVKPLIGDKNILEITKSDITDIMTNLTDELANRSINIVVEKISTIFNYGIKEKLFVAANPAKSIEKLSANNDRIRYLTKEEMKSLMEAVKGNNILYLFTFIALTTGGRLNAICSLEVQHINFSHLIINMYDDKNNERYKAFLKNDEYFINLLKEQIKNMSSTDLILGDNTVVGHKRYIQREMSKIFKKLFNKKVSKSEKETPEDKNLKAKARLNKVVVHTLRHTFASLLVIAGAPIYTVQNLMNHKDIKMTMRYAKLAPDSGRNFVDDIF